MKIDVNLNDTYDLLKRIDREIVDLADITRNLLLSVSDQYFLSTTPLWMMDAGHSQECAISKECFEKLLRANDGKQTNRFLYYYDWSALLFSLQNRFTVIAPLIEEVYKQLSAHAEFDIESVSATILSDKTSIHTHACINSIFINLASSCDLMTKVAYEVQMMPQLDFSIYPKMKSCKVLYSDKSKLPSELRRNDTYFSDARPLPIAVVETLRDEIVHNGSLDYDYNVYSTLIDGVFYNWILFPDFTEHGVFATYNGRRKFYSNGERTVNEELPKIVEKVLVLAVNTLKVMNNTVGTNTHIS